MICINITCMFMIVKINLQATINLHQNNYEKYKV